ncbi:double-CXXCG motif protein [Archangium lansingense]|uniref:double-CXXCG motif protein n=1 Tax=Archangium lansingense TaxID=2995310 RepID=UPI003B7A39C3
MRYFGWLHDLSDDSLAQVRRHSDDLEGKNYLLKQAVPLASIFPPKATYQLAEDRGIKLADSIPNLVGLQLISDKLKDVLNQETEGTLEFLPIQLRDQKSRIVDRPYFIANSLKMVSCLDMQRTQAKMSNIIKTDVMKFDNLVLDESKIPSDLKLFRLAGKAGFLIIREDLVQTIKDGGFTGVHFEAMEHFATDRKLLRRPELMG